MTHWRKIILAVLAALVLSGTGYADLMPMSPAEIAPGEALQACTCPVDPSADVAGSLLFPGISGFDSSGIGHLPLVEANAGQAGEAQALGIFSKEPRSLDLCLYALMGLGLCKSAPWVKKLSFGVIPGWYHDGGPFQIGHSYAVSPDCLCSAPVSCFIQPHGTAESPMPRYHFPTVVSLWRDSQFAPAVLASRGPPCVS